jgi:phytoene synthase
MANAPSVPATLDMLRQRDRALYAACLYTPETKRPMIAALYLLELELGGIRKLVSEPMPGEIRLQWWREVLSGDRAGEAAANPLAAAVMQAVEEYALPVALLDRLAEAHIGDLYDDPLPDVTALEAYFGETWSTIFQLCAQILGEGNAPPGDAAGHAGCAFGTARLLNNAAEQRRDHQVMVPDSMFAAAGTTREAFLSDRAALHDRLAEMLAGFGTAHRDEALKAVSVLPKANRAAFLPLAFCKQAFNRAQISRGAVFFEPEPASALGAQWALLGMAMRL